MPTPLQKQYMSSTPKSKTPAVARPSASILLISPSNQILLLHRVRTSSSFPSAHVFPGGNLEEKQDGPVPKEEEEGRHRDGEAYRRAAVRECFEESGILLARKRGEGSGGKGALLEVVEGEREWARKEIHAGRLGFGEWVEEKGGVLDTGMFNSLCLQERRWRGDGMPCLRKHFRGEGMRSRIFLIWDILEKGALWAAV